MYINDYSEDNSGRKKKYIAQVNLEPGTMTLAERVMCLDCAWEKFEETGQRYTSVQYLCHRVLEILWFGNDPIRKKLFEIKESQLTCAYTGEPVLGHNAWVVNCEAVESLLDKNRSEVFELVRNGYPKPSSVEEYENLGKSEQKRLFLLRLASQVSHGPKVDPRGCPNVVSNSVRKEIEEEFPESILNTDGQERTLFQPMQNLFLYWLEQQTELSSAPRRRVLSPLANLFFR